MWLRSGKISITDAKTQDVMYQVFVAICWPELDVTAGVESM